MSQQNAPQDFDLATLEGIAAYSLADKNMLLGHQRSVNGLYCPTCGAKRRVRTIRLFGSFTSLFADGYEKAANTDQILEVLGGNPSPFLLRFTCVQCETEFIVLIYQDASDNAHLAILPRVSGGLSTPNTPSGVAYYLDQAYKAQSIGAYSASVAMFRGALEHLLYEQGYQNGMLGSKIQNLKADVAARTAPKWALELDTEYLDVMTSLGNGAIHPNDGDVTRQSAIDTELLYLLTETFSTLLLLVYEIPHQKQANLGRLQARVQLLKK